MSLLYKPDWEETKETYVKWWNGEYIGRCAISVKAPISKSPARKPPLLPNTIEDRWLDFSYIESKNEYIMQNTYYGAEAFPLWSPGYPGCDSHCAYLGAEVHLAEETGWVDPIIDNGIITEHDYKKLKLDKNGRWWNFGCSLRLFAVEKTRNRSIVGNMAFGGCGDTLAALRSTNQLLYDVIDNPDYVREFDLYLMDQWIEIYENSYNITKESAQGSTCFFALWSPGKFYAVHNDFAYMISPKMFENIFLPSIKKQTDYLDHAIYHVDGIGNFAHVDSLLELPKIQAYQILPGEGKPSPLHYMDILKKIQKAGRNLHITIKPSEVTYALESLSAKGLFIDTVCDTVEDVYDLLKMVEKESKVIDKIQ